MTLLIDQDGMPEEVSQADADFLRNLGWTDPSPEALKAKEIEERNSGVGNAILNVATTAGADMFPGLPGLAAKMGTGLSPEAKKELSEARGPGEQVLGHILGFGLPAVATMGAGTAAQAGKAGVQGAVGLTAPALISKAGLAVTEKLGGGLAAKVAGAGVEGALIGGTELVNKLADGDDPAFNAETVLAHPDEAGIYALEHVLEGTVPSAIMGGAFGVVGAGISRAATAAGKSKVVDYVIGRMSGAQGEALLQAGAGGTVNSKAPVNAWLKRRGGTAEAYEQLIDTAKNAAPDKLDLVLSKNGLVLHPDETLRRISEKAPVVGHAFDAAGDEADRVLVQKFGRDVPLAVPLLETAESELKVLEREADKAIEGYALLANKSSASKALGEAGLLLEKKADDLRIQRTVDEADYAISSLKNKLETEVDDRADEALRLGNRFEAANELNASRLELANNVNDLQLQRAADARAAAKVSQGEQVGAAMLDPQKALRNDVVAMMKAQGSSAETAASAADAVVRLGYTSMNAEAIGVAAQFARGSGEAYQRIVRDLAAKPAKTGADVLMEAAEANARISPETAALIEKVNASRQRVLAARADAITATAEDRSAAVMMANRKLADAQDRLAKFQQGKSKVSPKQRQLIQEVNDAKKAKLLAREKAMGAVADDKNARVHTSKQKAQEKLNALNEYRMGLAKRAVDVSNKTEWALDDVWKNIRRDVIDPLKERWGGENVVEKVEAFIEKYEKAFPTGVHMGELHKLRQAADDSAFGFAGTIDPRVQAVNEAFLKVRNKLSDELERRFELAGQGNAWRKANKDWTTLTLFRELARNGAAGEAMNTRGGLINAGTGAAVAVAGGMTPGSVFSGVATTEAMRLARRNVPGATYAVAGKTVDMLERMKTLKTWNTNALSDAASRILAGGRRATTRSMMEEGPVKAQVATKDKATTQAARAQADFRKKVEAVRGLRDPEVQAERLAAVTSEWRDGAPQTATMAQALMAKQVAFLLSKLPPVPPMSLMQTVAGTPPTYSSNTISKFNRYYATTRSPLAALEAAAAGALMREHIETLDAVWPKQKIELLRHINEAVASSGGTIPARSRGSLGMLMSHSVRKTTPTAMQLLYHPEPEPEQPKQNPKTAGLTQAARNSLHPNPGPKGR